MQNGAAQFCPIEIGGKLATPDFTAFYQRWDEARGGADLPHKSHIRPAEIAPRFLPYITIIGVENHGTRFVIRLAGSAILETTRVEMTGWQVDEAQPKPQQEPFSIDDSQASLERMKWSMSNRAPYCMGARASWSGDDMLVQRTLVLPYVGDEGTVERFLTLNDLEYADDPCRNCEARDCKAKELQTPDRIVREAHVTRR
ncbi:MAG: PAS domain-containing protein [Candidatus Phaeomarinobacter sp.]